MKIEENTLKMTKSLALSILAVITCPLFTDGSELIAEDHDSIKISLLPDSENPLNVSDTDKQILRYGFHRTYDCQHFEKAFLCIRKCLDLNYHIAHADKKCICTCYKNRILAQYKLQDTASTKWKLGAPTTSRPSWAGGVMENKPHDYEINAKYTEYIEEAKKAHSKPSEAEEDSPTEAVTTESDVTHYEEVTSTLSAAEDEMAPTPEAEAENEAQNEEEKGGEE